MLKLDESPFSAVRSRAILDRLRSVSDDSRRVVIRGATVITMDPMVPDLVRGNVHLSGRFIERIEPCDEGTEVPDGTIVVPAEGCIVIPGFHDTHRHCWQTQLRRMFAAVDLDDYVEVAHAKLAPQYRPQDIYIATLLAGLGAINGGVTSLLDFAHNTRSAAHADASLQGHLDSGIRSVVAVGPPLSGSWEQQWPLDMDRIVGAATDPRLSIAFGVFGTSELGGDDIALTAKNVRHSRALGVPIVVDATFGPSASKNIEQLGDAGLLGPDVTLIHCTALTERAWDYIQRFGVRVSLTTTSDAEIGIFGGNPPIQEALDRGIRPGLSVDVECSLSGDMFAQIRATYTIQRMRAFAASTSSENPPAPISPRRVLEMATIDGAKVNRLDAESGTITPGKKADLVVISANDIATMPLNNAVSSITLGTDASSVRDVFVDGRIRKWDGAMVDVDIDELRSRVIDSRDYLLRKSGYSSDALR